MTFSTMPPAWWRLLRVLGRPAEEKEVKAALDYIGSFPGLRGQAGRLRVDQFLPRFGGFQRLHLYPLRDLMPDTSNLLSRRIFFAMPAAGLGCWVLPAC